MDRTMRYVGGRQVIARGRSCSSVGSDRCSSRSQDPLQVQRAIYHDAIAACAGTPGFAGVTFWGVTDAHSWIDARFGEDDPLLFDADYLPKPAYFGARAALAAGGR
jgi:GH35 family endo-1,4-beta-xylanase